VFTGKSFKAYKKKWKQFTAMSLTAVVKSFCPSSELNINKIETDV
jgi:hypothetical protein